METPQHTYLSRLDHLRFYAAALVLLFHYLHTHVGDLRSGNPLVSLLDEGHSGIALFMVISGFIFTVIASDRPLRYGGFIKNRVLRIYPLFVFAVFLQLFISTYNDHRNYGLLQLLGWLVPFRSDTVGLSPHFVQLWTVWVEFQFYLIFPFLLAFTRRHGTRYLWGWLLLLVLVRALVYAASGSVRYIAYETLFGRLDQFMIGMLLAYQWQRRRPVAGTSPVWLLLAVLAVLLGLHLFSRRVGFTNIDSPLWVLWPGVEALLWANLVWAYLTARWPRWCWPLGWRAPLDHTLAALGAVSFSTYVLHNLVIIAYQRHLPMLHTGLGEVPDAIVTGLCVILPCVLLLSGITFNLLEKPFLTLRSRYLG